MNKMGKSLRMVLVNNFQPPHACSHTHMCTHTHENGKRKGNNKRVCAKELDIGFFSASLDVSEAHSLMT